MLGLMALVCALAGASGAGYAAAPLVGTVAEGIVTERFANSATLSRRNTLKLQRQSGDIRQVADPLGGAGPVYRFEAGPKGKRVGKAALILPFETLHPGDSLSVRAELMVPEGAPLNSVHLMDVECKRCGQKGNPGVRLYLRDGRLRVDRKKIGKRHAWALAEAPRLPAGRWVEVTWTLQLGLDDDPTLSLVGLEGRAVLRNRGRNLPDVPRAKAGVDRLQIGVTANSNDRPGVVYLRALELTMIRAKAGANRAAEDGR